EGQAASVADGYRDGGIAGDRARSGAASARTRVAIHQIDQPWCARRRRDDRVDAMLRERRVEPLGARHRATVRERLPIAGARERSLLLRHLEDLLLEVRQLDVGVGAVEGDERVERARADSGRARGEVALEVGLELVQ